jgi:hypothetical protein
LCESEAEELEEDVKETLEVHVEPISVPEVVPSPKIVAPTLESLSITQNTEKTTQDPMTFMYITMLQQQMSALQSQLYSTRLTFANPELPLEKKKETRSIGVNTDPLIQPTMVSVYASTEPLRKTVTTEASTNTIDEDITPRGSPLIERSGINMATMNPSDLESRLESLQRTENSIPIPVDTGNNFKYLYDYDDPSKPPSTVLEELDSDISFAQQVIPQLVGNCEDSFVYHESEPESMGPNVFVKSKESKSHHLFSIESSRLNSSILEDPSSVRDQSLSFDTINYLKKYGL